jgi:hypothetical protein
MQAWQALQWDTEELNALLQQRTPRQDEVRESLERLHATEAKFRPRFFCLGRRGVDPGGERRGGRRLGACRVAVGNASAIAYGVIAR